MKARIPFTDMITEKLFLHIGHRIVPFSTSVVKIVHPEEYEAPPTASKNPAGTNDAPPPQSTVQVPPEIALRIKRTSSEYGDLPLEPGYVCDEVSNAFLDLASEILKLRNFMNKVHHLCSPQW